jgi:hypothetical protein
MRDPDLQRSLADLALDERRLLEKLDELTPTKSRRQARDDRTGQEVGEAAHLSQVPVADSTRIAYGFKKLAEAGLVERTNGNGPARYRVTQLGERALLNSRLRHLEREVAERDSRLEIAARTEERLLARIGELERRPWWRRALGT